VKTTVPTGASGPHERESRVLVGRHRFGRIHHEQKKHARTFRIKRELSPHGRVLELAVAQKVISSALGNSRILLL
jgi:hypothetical protein